MQEAGSLHRSPMQPFAPAFSAPGPSGLQHAHMGGVPQVCPYKHAPDMLCSSMPGLQGTVSAPANACKYLHAICPCKQESSGCSLTGLLVACPVYSDLWVQSCMQGYQPRHQTGSPLAPGYGYPAPPPAPALQNGVHGGFAAFDSPAAVAAARPALGGGSLF